MRTKVVLEEVGARENGAKTWAAQKYSLTRPRAKLWNKHLWIKGSCWGKGIDWLTKLRPAKKTPLISLPNHLLESIWIKSMFPYALLPHHKGVKWNTIGITKRASAKVPHCMGHVLAYPMENKMSLVHHSIEQWGCSYTNKDDKGLIERTQGHIMLKPSPSLCRWNGDKGRY
jgi:hypothetical protein